MRSLLYNVKMGKDPKKFSRSELRYLFRRVLKRIKEKPRGYFRLMKLRGACGYCYFDSAIEIDYRKLLIPTIIHEVLHDLYPDNWEGWTLRLESKLVNILSPYDIYQLMFVFFSKVEISKPKRKYKKKKSRFKSNNRLINKR
jgi:hypothetical protein